jgi:hypothetical protein
MRQFSASAAAGTGYSKAELAELRQLWIEIGDEYMAQRREARPRVRQAKRGAQMMFGTPAECIAKDAAKAAKKAKREVKRGRSSRFG